MRLNEIKCVRNDVQAFGSVRVWKIRTQVKFAVYTFPGLLGGQLHLD